MKLKSIVHEWILFFLGAIIVPLAGFSERDAASAEYPENARQTLARTAAYLWGKQSPDGSWRSGTVNGTTVNMWNGVYDGQGGDINGEYAPPSECDNFWLYLP